MGILTWANRFRHSTRIFRAIGVASTGFVAIGGADAPAAVVDQPEPTTLVATVPERVAAIRARLSEEQTRHGEMNPALQRLAQFVNFPNFPNFPNAFPNFPNAVGMPPMGGPRPTGPPGFPNFPNFPNAPR